MAKLENAESDLMNRGGHVLSEVNNWTLLRVRVPSGYLPNKDSEKRKQLMDSKSLIDRLFTLIEGEDSYVYAYHQDFAADFIYIILNGGQHDRVYRYQSRIKGRVFNFQEVMNNCRHPDYAFTLLENHAREVDIKLSFDQVVKVDLKGQADALLDELFSIPSPRIETDLSNWL